MRPLPNDGSHRVTSVMMVGGKEFLQTIKEEKTTCFSIIVIPKKEVKVMPQAKSMEHQVGPREVRDLLEQYKSVVAGRELECLPPQREISHCID